MQQIKLALAKLNLLLGVILLSSAVYAQTVNGSFSGRVTDQTGAVIPGATVRIVNNATGVSRETVTDATGNYVLPDIRPGVYSMEVTKTGFARLRNPSVTLLVNQNASLDLVLKPGAVTTMVTVTGQAPLANVTNATVGTVVNSQDVVQLPLNGRQFTQLILLTPGAAPQSSGQQGFFEVHSDMGAVSPAVNGARPEMNNYTMDGIENNEYFFNFPVINPPPDAIHEFNVQSNMSSGQYGRAAGANVNVVTRSGANEIHGDAWEFLRNTNLDARNFFNPTRSVFHQNQFGATLGGPVLKNKVWAFGWYEGFRKSLGSSILSRVPTPAELNGDLSAFAQIYDPFTTHQVGTDGQGNPIFARDLIQNNQIPSGMLNSTALALSKQLYPSPNYTGQGVNYLDSEPVVTNSNQYGIRIDVALSAGTTFFGRFAYDKAERTLPTGNPAQPVFQEQPGLQQVLGFTHIFSPTTVLSLHGGFVRSSIKLTGNFPTSEFMQQTGLINDFPPNPGLNPVYPGMNVSDVTGLPATAQSLPGAPINSWEYGGNLTKIVSSHTITAGASIIHTAGIDNCTYAAASFDNLPTSDPQNTTTTGSGLASFLLGVPSSGFGLRGSALQDLVGNYYGLFVDDAWKTTPKLTVNLSLRYDYAPPLTERQGRQGSVDWVNSTPTHTVYLVNEKAQPSVDLSQSSAEIVRVPNMFNADRTNFAPRVSAAYRLPYDFAIRSGYGIFYDFNQSNFQDIQDIMGQFPFGFPQVTPGNLNQPTVANPLPQNILGVNIFPPFVPSPDPPEAPGFVANRDNKRPYVQEWDLGLEKPIGNDWLVSATYLGSKGTHLPLSPAINIATTPGPGPLAPRQPLPQFAPFEVTGHWGNSSYQAGQLKVERRFSQGLMFLASYTWSKSIDLQGSVHGSAQPGEGIQDGLNFKGNRGVSDFDTPQNFVFSSVYDLPLGKGKRYLSGGGLADYVIGGWELTGILSLHSGFPFGIIIPFDNANTGSTFGGPQRPSLIGPLLPSGFQQNVDHWFDPSALTVIPYTYGTLGRNVVRQDAFKNLDFGIYKNTNITERAKLQFRAEFFNLANHPNFGAPDNNFSSTTFGQVLSADNPRFIQFGIKLLF